VARRKATLLVSATLVHEADGAKPWVLKAQDGHVVRVQVRLGLRSSGFAELLEGVNEGDVLLPATAGVTAGARVTVSVKEPS